MDPRPRPSIDFNRAVTFVVNDPRWPSRLLIAAFLIALSAVVIGLPILLGSLGRLFRDAVQDDRPELPGWSPRRDMAEGIPVLAVVLVYAVPGIVLAQLPIVGRTLSALYIAAAIFLVPAALTHMFVLQSVPAAFDLDWILSYIADNLGHYVGLILFWTIALFAAIAGVLAFGVGVLFTSAWGVLAGIHVMAQVYRLSRLHGTPAPVEAEEPSAPAAFAT